MATGRTIDIDKLVSPDDLALEVVDKWRVWDGQIEVKKKEWSEVRDYVYATDTKTTSNAMTPWSNSTTIPKLTQISDNLHANYFATLFPQMKWMKWEGDSRNTNTAAKKEVIQAYMENKVDQSGFVDTMSDLLRDWITYGNCFAQVVYEDASTPMENGEVITRYTGPKLERISPWDIRFNPVAAEFSQTPKIIKSIKTFGDIALMVDEQPENADLKDVLDRMVDSRAAISDAQESRKNQAYIADGFSSLREYYDSDYVELLTFRGDVFDKVTRTLRKNRVITVVDRRYILSDKEGPEWNGTAPIFHSGWRTRPDNLYGMGPLDNLVGIQYRVDHLENMKADVFDNIAFPKKVIAGEVEAFEDKPNENIFVGEEGSVGYLHPDTTALNADFQIPALLNLMEEMAGAPKQAMGIRTAGEKTAFEVSTLAEAGNRIFVHKTNHFERTFEEPILNAMLETSRRNMNTADTLRVLNDSTGVVVFKDISKDDIIGTGSIKPIGARHFAERAQRLQNLTQLHQIKLGDPTVAPHLSGKVLAKILTEELREPDMYSENISVHEQMETQQVAQEAQVQAEEEQQIAAELGI